MNVHKNRITDPVVTLVCMPWTAVIEPSLGLGILKAKLKEAQIQARVFYGHIRLLKYMRLHTYDMMGANFALNDWLFTHVFETGTDPVQAESVAGFARFFWEEKTFETYKKFNSSDDILSMLYRIRNESIPRYLDECCTEVLADNPTMVGFTCLFDQTIASLALARLIKQRRPEITTVMGGYALEGPLSKQIIDCFPFIDCVVTGEGEPAIVPLAQASVGKATFAQVPGAIYRENGNTVFA
ncbi:MAG: cobalamin-dependent protein, partial [Dinghuibacter sp.]|nr:cobalamin-dependent protein [Dinghuibacter sp.]